MRHGKFTVMYKPSHSISGDTISTQMTIHKGSVLQLPDHGTPKLQNNGHCNYNTPDLKFGARVSSLLNEQ